MTYLMSLNYRLRGGLFMLALAAVLAAWAMPVLAADYTGLTAAVDFADVITAILGVAAVIAGVYVVWRGVKFIYAAIRA